jgi:hypothetical protein
MNSFFKFSLSLLVVLLAVFVIHIAILDQLGRPLFNDRILAAYLINYFLAVLIYLMLFLLRKKMTAHLGFLYMGGSFVKFIFFFIFFYPVYKMDGKLDSFEFAAFFIPYVISLIFETLGTIKFLKK